MQDFYVASAGGCDLGGALLLALGLISRSAQLTWLSGSFYGSNAYQAASVAIVAGRSNPTSTSAVDEYVSYWTDWIGSTADLPREEWDGELSA